MHRAGRAEQSFSRKRGSAHGCHVGALHSVRESSVEQHVKLLTDKLGIIKTFFERSTGEPPSPLRRCFHQHRTRWVTSVREFGGGVDERASAELVVDQIFSHRAEGADDAFRGRASLGNLSPSG